MDQTIAEEVESVFRESPYHQLRRITCESRAGVLTLHGTVSSFYLKQQAQAVAQAIEAVVDVDNQIEVS